MREAIKSLIARWRASALEPRAPIDIVLDECASELEALLAENHNFKLLAVPCELAEQLRAIARADDRSDWALGRVADLVRLIDIEDEGPDVCRRCGGELVVERCSSRWSRWSWDISCVPCQVAWNGGDTREHAQHKIDTRIVYR